MSSPTAQPSAPVTSDAVSTPPPHEVKQGWVARFQAAFAVSTLIETGTYCGDMVQAQLDRFASVYSIELDVGYCPP